MSGRTPDDRADPPLAGLTSGTLVETETGWQMVETVRPGQQVYTLDGTAHPVCRIERRYLGAEIAGEFPQGLMLVPGGAIGNCEAFYLLPDCHVLFTGSAVEGLSGESAALVRAGDLAGNAGIEQAFPVDGIEIVRLSFNEEEIIYANTGALIHCPDPEGADEAISQAFPVLDARDAQVLMACWAGMREETQAAAGRPLSGGHTGSRTAAA